MNALYDQLHCSNSLIECTRWKGHSEKSVSYHNRLHYAYIIRTLLLSPSALTSLTTFTTLYFRHSHMCVTTGHFPPIFSNSSLSTSSTSSFSSMSSRTKSEAPTPSSSQNSLSVNKHRLSFFHVFLGAEMDFEKMINVSREQKRERSQWPNFEREPPPRRNS